MIKTIIHCADIHILNTKRHEEYQEILTRFINECKAIVEKHESPQEVRIVIAGDLVHNKLDISSEGYILASWFLNELDDVAPTIIIAGNHDMNMDNIERIDPLSAIFTMCRFKNTIYLDKELGYQSGCMRDENVVWCLYSSFDNFAKPDLTGVRKNDDDRLVCLFHGELKNSKTDVGFVFENGMPESYFDGVDFGLLGHVHKRQCIKNNGVPLVYASSMLQKDAGENISGHGYVVWDVEKCSYEAVDIPNPNYGFYTVVINSIDDIDNNLETIINM